MAADPLESIQCASQPLGISFHPSRRLFASGLVDGSVEVHDYSTLLGGAQSEKNDASQHRHRHRRRGRGSCDQGSDGDGEGGDDDGESCSSSSSSSSRSIPPTLVASVSSVARNSKSCRAVTFSRDLDDETDGGGGGGGSHLFCGGGDSSLSCLDVERISADNGGGGAGGVRGDNGEHATLWRIGDAHPASSGINRMMQLPAAKSGGPLLVTGDDVGTVRLWDARLCGGNGGAGVNGNWKGSYPPGCVGHWSCHSDYVSGLDCDEGGRTLLVTSGDCTLSAIDIRKGMGSFQRARNRPSSAEAESSGTRMGVIGQSDDQEDELLSLKVMKGGRKVVCGTQEGVLAIWSWGTWGDVSDRWPGHPRSVDALLKIDEDTLITGSGDGLLRVVQLHPNRLLGVLGGHDGFPVEELKFGGDRSVVGSLSHDSMVRLWDASVLQEDDDESDDHKEEEDEDDEEAKRECRVEADRNNTQEQQSTKSVVWKTSSINNAWSDEEEDKDDVTGDDDSDDSGDGGGRGNRECGRKKLKTENERFFEDL